MLETSYYQEMFKDWASSLSSFDGGNLNAAVWFSAVSDDGFNVFNPGSWRKVERSDCPHENSGDSRAAIFNISHANRNFLKLHAAIFGEFNSSGEFDFEGKEENKSYPNDPDYFAYSNKYGVFEKRPEHNERSIFRINLFPMPIHIATSEWNSKFTGFIDSSNYMNWCKQHRFPVIRRSVVINTSPPKAIICMGGSFENDFVSAFLREKAVSNEQSISCYQNFKESPLLFIVPCVGDQNRKCADDKVNDMKIFELGSNIRNVLIEKRLLDPVTNCFINTG